MKKYVEIYGKQYEMEVNKLKIKQYEKHAKRIKKLNEKIVRTPDNASLSVKGKLKDEAERVYQEFFNEALGKGAFEEIYEGAGRLVGAMTPIALDVLNYARGKKKGQSIKQG